MVQPITEEQWHSVDWNLTIPVIAAQLGCGTTTVYKHRKRNATLAEIKRGPKGPRKTAEIDWNSIDWALNAKIIAAKLGLNPVTVYRYRTLFAPGVKMKPGKTGLANPEVMDWSKHDNELAKEYGLTRRGINYLRKKYAKSTLKGHQKKVKDESWATVDWSLTAREIAHSLGCSMSTVAKQRQKMRHHP